MTPLRLLRTFDNFFPANILLTRLQSDGIESYLMDENTVTIDPLLSNAIGGIKLMVRADQESLARELLRRYDAGTGLPAATCPQCGSSDIGINTEMTPEEWLDAAVSIPLLPGSPPENRGCICSSCGTPFG
jgi:hypothetical protein